MKISVKRKGYHRKGYYIHRYGKRIYIPPTYIKGTTYKTTDRGKRGKTPRSKQWYHPRRKMKTGKSEWHSYESAKQRHRVLSSLVKKRGYATVVRELVSLKNVTTDRNTKHVCSEDLRWLQKNYH